MCPDNWLFDKFLQIHSKHCGGKYEKHKIDYNTVSCSKFTIPFGMQPDNWLLEISLNINKLLSIIIQY